MEADQRQNNTLLRRAIQCFHRSRPRYAYQFLPHVATNLYGVAEQGYGHLSKAISRLGDGLHPYAGYLLRLCVIMLPYGYKFEKDRLLQKLLRQAGILYSDSLAIEAQHYIFDVVNRCAINHAAANSRLGNADEAGAWQWNVTQRQHQLLASKSAEMDFIYTSDTLNLLAAASATDHGSQSSRTPRRLALHQDHPDIPSLLENVHFSQTRSVVVSGVVTRSVPLHRFVNLVVLDVEGWENFGDEDLLRICTSKMFFLVYLSIRSTPVTKLPPEINELCSLRVLDASYTRATEFPFRDLKATRLRRLDLRGTPISKLTLPKETLELQDSLHTLLLGGEGMINSTKTATRLPYDIRRLMGLRTLATVDLSEESASFISSLGVLVKLRVLAITWSFHQSSNREYCEALLSSIKNYWYLKSLTIHCGLGCSMEFLGSLLSGRRPRNLEKFKVTVGRFEGVSQWFRGLVHLCFVQITICKLEAHDLEILRDLPKLECLVLGLDFIPKEAIVIQNEGFRELQRLSIECPVPWLTFESGAMPKLTYLQLEFHACPTSPGSVPMGISNLRHLTKVALWYNVRYANSSSVNRTVEAARVEVAKCRNDTQMVSLFINGAEQYDVQAVNVEIESATRAPSGASAGAEDDIPDVDEIIEA